MRACATIALILLLLSAPCIAQDLMTNGSFESGISGWTTNPSYPVSVVSSYNGVGPADGSKLLVLAGPASVGYSYAQVVSKSLSAPFGTGLPTDNFVVYLYASTYLHTNDGRNVSFAVTLGPGYGQCGSLFHQGPQNSWATAQTWGYYIAHDPFDSSLPVKPITVSLELRDSLQSGEYLLLDHVQLYYGGPGIPEPASILVVLVGIGFFITKARPSTGSGARSTK
jgi:hypothetical protein